MNKTIFTAKEAKNNFGRLLDEAREYPISIEKHGREVAVLLSARAYQEFKMTQDAYWGKLASLSNKKGYIGTAGSSKILKKIIDARD
ncbi:MAG: type II toxin-antitoxin system Phd/YefM family antitoxin [Candidatus Taylorbacteria bacterium]